MSRYYYKGKTSVKSIFVFSFISVLIHFLILLVISFNYPFQNFHAESPPEIKYYEITEYIPPKDKKTKPPEDPKLLSEKDHKTEKESAPSTNTQLSKQTAAKPRTQNQSQAANPDSSEQLKTSSRSDTDKSSDAPLKEDSVSLVKKQPWLKRKSEGKADAPDKDLNEGESRIARQVPEMFVPYRSELLPEAGAKHLKKKEDTVDLSTLQFKYHSYFIGLKNQIKNVWHYPKDAATRGEHGKMNLIFTISSNGDLENFKVLRSSGHSSLDDEALRAIKVAAPYHPFPKSWEGMERLNIRASFEYNSPRSFYFRYW